MRGVTGQWGLEVKVKGKDLNLDAMNLTHLNLVSNIQQSLPTLSVGFKDDSGEILDNLMADGDEVKISIGNPGSHMYNDLNFLVSGSPKVHPYGSSIVIAFNAVLNNVEWLRKMVDKPYKGTAADVIKQLAEEAGLSTEVDSSQDDMTWLPNQLPLVGYAFHILRRSFAGEGDALIMGITDAAKLKLKSLNNLISGSGMTLASDETKGHPVLHWTTVPKANATNPSHGYGSTSIGVNLDGTIFEGNDVAMKLMSQTTSMMSGIKDVIGKTGMRINALAPLAGNTHEKWYEGIHQNPRILSTYAFDIELLTDIPTKLELLDTPTFLPRNTANGTDASAIAGKYIVTAINKTIVQGRYLEKLVITAQSSGGV